MCSDARYHALVDAEMARCSRSFRSILADCSLLSRFFSRIGSQAATRRRIAISRPESSRLLDIRLSLSMGYAQSRRIAYEQR